MRKLRATALLLVSASLLAQDTRVASDFELAAARRRLAEARLPVDRIAAQLNLGDVQSARLESSNANAAYREARRLADAERSRARRASELDPYARATSYLGLAEAKLGREREAIAAFDESVRYLADSAANWNRYASAMTILGRADLALRFSTNAVAIATADADASPSAALDAAVYRYAQASALAALQQDDDAIKALREIEAELTSDRFADVRREIARAEEFETLSSTRSDSGAYIALLQRARLRLAALEERNGRLDGARSVYERVLAARSDEPTALAALTRLSTNANERISQFAAAFDADPFSPTLLRSYEQFAKEQRVQTEGASLGARVRRVVEAIAAGRAEAAREELSGIATQNDATRYLAARIALEANDRAAAESAAEQIANRELRGALEQHLRDARSATLAWNDLLQRSELSADEATQLTRTDFASLLPEQRAELDAHEFRLAVTLDQPRLVGESTSATGAHRGDLALRFAQPTNFRGDFTTAGLVTLSFRLLGVAEGNTGRVLVVEPTGVRR